MFPSLQDLLVLGAIAATLVHAVNPVEQAQIICNSISDANTMMDGGATIHTDQFETTLKKLMLEGVNLAAEVGQNNPAFKAPVKDGAFNEGATIEDWLEVLKTFPTKLEEVAEKSSSIIVVENFETAIIACTKLVALVERFLKSRLETHFRGLALN
jgi:hypothetical protein